MKKRLSLITVAVLFLFAISFMPGQSSDPLWWYERGVNSMISEDWYMAAESFLESLRVSPSHAESTAALAECYYELGELDEAYSWVEKARTLARGNMDLANLEAFILIAMGRLDDASAVVTDTLRREPYNKEALFAAAELDIARGRTGEAVNRFREANRRYPDDRRLLVSMALVLGSMGDTRAAQGFIDRALTLHSGDYRVHYYAAYLASREGRVEEASAHVQRSLYYRPAYIPAQSLLASLRYRAGRYEEAAQLADELIIRNRRDSGAWYLKGMSLIRMGKSAEALSIFSTASSISPDDEYIRYALEDLLINTTRVEDPGRIQWAVWHFNRARDFRSRNLVEQALFEYRRGLRLNPYARDRREYADLLRLMGYPARYLEELRFMQDLGLGDVSLNDAVESYDALLRDALFRLWNVDPVNITIPHWNIAVFSIASQSTSIHADAAAAGAAYIREILVHERNVYPMNMDLRQPSFSAAFRAAREGKADYFIIISISENERDISIKGELFTARTGAPAAVFNAYRTGQDRLRNASRNIVDQLNRALPFRAQLIARRSGEGLIDKGRADGVRDNTAYDIVRLGSAEILNEGIGLVYPAADIVGRIVIENADEEIASGKMTRVGFFDRIGLGDEIFLVPSENHSLLTPSSVSVDPELRNLLRTMR